MASRIKKIRVAFRKALEDLGAPGKWNYVTDQGGMFILINLTSEYWINIKTFTEYDIAAEI